jgi:hypothetical protein
VRIEVDSAIGRVTSECSHESTLAFQDFEPLARGKAEHPVDQRAIDARTGWRSGGFP